MHTIYSKYILFKLKFILNIYIYQYICRFSKISIWEICFPPKILNTEREPFDERKSEIEEELKTYNLMISQFFNTILNKIMALPISESMAYHMFYYFVY